MIEYVGKLDRKAVNELYGRSRVGVCIYQPASNHYDAQPIKLFEFMAAGLPIVASNFPLWKKLVEENKCGTCVDPTDSAAVRQALSIYLDDPELAQRTGMNGRMYIEKHSNWESEESKLISLYIDLCNE